MTTVNPRDLAGELFAHYPNALRPYALQIQCVLAGIKPACLIAMNADYLGDCLTYLRSLNLEITVKQYHRSPTSFAQASPTFRTEALAKPRVRVYVAKSAADARRLAKLEMVQRDYRAAGLALGYPVCCVETASERDQIFFDERYDLWRQANLTSAAAEASTTLDYRCNFLWSESDLSSLGPLTLIAHSPCHFACTESTAFGELAFKCCAETWPLWSAALQELLRAPVIYWSDALWPPECWSEFCGVALFSGYQEQDSVWQCRRPAMLLGAEKTPAKDLPYDVMKVQIMKDRIILHAAAGGITALPFQETGHPWLMDWQEGTIHKLP